MNLEKRHKEYTLIIYSGPKEKIRKLTISQNFLRFVYIFVIIAVASAVIVISNLLITRQKLNEKIAEIERIEYKINYKEVELVSLEKKTSEIQSKTKLLENYLKEVQKLDKLVKSITGQGGLDGDGEFTAQGVPESDKKFTGQGGPESSQAFIYEYNIMQDTVLLSSAEEDNQYTLDQEEEIDDINALLDGLLAKAPELAESLKKDKQDMEDYLYVKAHTPSIWPTWGTITTLFSDGRSSTRWIPGSHKGIDIANNTGTNISATADGVVIFTGYHGGYGNKVIIYHMDKYTTVYAHLSKILVSEGEKVTQGQIIGKMGSTGRSTGPHLHYEVYVDGVPHNPKEFLP